MTGDMRPQLAREHLDAAQHIPVEQMPPMVLARECAESRRHLAALLAVIEGQAAALDAGELATVLDALDVAADHKRDLAANCPDCEAHPAELCSTCEWRLARATAYDALSAKLREAAR